MMFQDSVLLSFQVYEFNWFVTCIGRWRSTGKKWVFLHQLALLDALNAFFLRPEDSCLDRWKIRQLPCRAYLNSFCCLIWCKKTDSDFLLVCLTLWTNPMTSSHRSPMIVSTIYHLPYCISKVSSRIPNLTFRCRISNSDVSPRGLPLRTSSQMEISILRTWSCESCHDASVHDVKKLEAVGSPVFNMLNCEICSACIFFWAFTLPFTSVSYAMDVFLQVGF